MKQQSKQKRLAAITLLADYDHCFITENGVRKICTPFGYRAECHPGHSDAGPNNPKGLTMAPGKEGTLGRDATDLAEELCRKFNLKYRNDFFGRGRQLHECCRALREYVEECE
jgi:hypothetical protein